MMHTRRSSFSVVAILVTAIASGRPARAQGREETESTADTSFFEGRKLMAEKRYAEACPKFARADALRAGVGTKLNLADCLEKLGKTASAWRTFLEAATAAEAMNDDRLGFARTRAVAIEARLMKVNVSVAPSADIAGLEVAIDGATWPRSLWGRPRPVDPGVLHVEARAPGRTSWNAMVEVTEQGTERTIEIPLLALEAGPASMATVPPPRESPPRPEANASSGLGAQRTMALVATGIGLVSVGVGTAFGLTSRSRRDEAGGHCGYGPTGDQCDHEGVRLGDEAISAGNLSTAFFAAGAAGIGAGALLWFTAPKRGRTVSVAVTPARGGANVGLRSEW